MTQASDTLSEKDVRVIKSLLKLGFQHKRIASLFDCNQGRIAEINSGGKYARVPDLFGDVLPFPIKRRGDDK